MSWFWRSDRRVRTLPASAGVCPQAYGKRHVTSRNVENKICLLCGTVLTS